MPTPPPFDDDSAMVIPTHQLTTPAFTVLQRVRGKLGTHDVAFECAVRLAQGKLSLTGMTLYGARAFEIEQIGADVHWRAFELDDLPFETMQVLVDVHRVFFRGLPSPQTNGEHERVQGDQIVREFWRGGQIEERSFHSLDTSASLVVISFEGAPAPVIAPRVRLVNLHYNYWLEIENIQQERLREDYTLTVEKRAP
jgi:hypothetical protein